MRQVMIWMIQNKSQSYNRNSNAIKIKKSNKKLKKWCTIMRQIWVVFPSNQMKVFNYIDGVLYWPGLDEDDVAAQRADKLSKILNEK